MPNGVLYNMTWHMRNFPKCLPRPLMRANNWISNNNFVLIEATGTEATLLIYLTCKIDMKSNPISIQIFSKLLERMVHVNKSLLIYVFPGTIWITLRVEQKQDFPEICEKYFDEFVWVEWVRRQNYEI